MWVTRRVVVRARGHPLIRATHGKTLEFTREAVVTERATCVVGVEARFDPDSLGLLRGRVRLTVRAGGQEVSGEAVVNPAHRVSERLVVRRSLFTDPDTLAVGATLTAAELPAEMVAVLADAEAEVTLSVAEVEPAEPLVLVGRDGSPVPAGRVGLLWRNADHAVSLGSGAVPDAGALLEDDGVVVAVTVPGTLEVMPPQVAAWLTGAAAHGARIAVAGSGPVESLLAAGFPPAPALWLGRVSRRSVRRSEIGGLLQAASVPAVFTVPLEEAGAVLETVAAAAPRRQVAVPDGRLDVGTKMTWVEAAQAADAVGRLPGEEATVVLAPSGGGEVVALEGLVRALASAGVAPRTVSQALRPLGVSRRRIYEIMDAGSPDGR